MATLSTDNIPPDAVCAFCAMPATIRYGKRTLLCDDHAYLAVADEPLVQDVTATTRQAIPARSRERARRATHHLTL